MNANHATPSLSAGLGNVLTTISDRKKRLAGATPAFEAVIETAQDYYPFGSLMPGRKYNAGEYRFGFNGQEKDDEIAGVTGSHLDFGARIYDSRLGRWLSIDPFFKLYSPISPYVFSLNNPIIFTDEQGNYVIGSDGKAVTYTKGKEGQIIWSSNATDDVKRIGEALFKTRTGSQIFESMQNTKYGINLKMSPNIDPKALGRTIKWDPQTKKGTISKVDIIIFEGNLIDMKNNVLVSNCNYNSPQGMLFQNSIERTGNIEEAIGAVAAHEGIHATDPKNIQESLSNKYLGTSFDVETKPEEIETQFLIESIPLNKIQSKRVDSVPVSNTQEEIKRK